MGENVVFIHRHVYQSDSNYQVCYHGDSNYQVCYHGDSNYQVCYHSVRKFDKNASLIVAKGGGRRGVLRGRSPPTLRSKQ